MPTLKKETIGAYCQTRFQNMLVEILYICPGKFYEEAIDSEMIKLNNYFEVNLKKFENFHKDRGVNYLLEARWYIYETIADRF